MMDACFIDVLNITLLYLVSVNWIIVVLENRFWKMLNGTKLSSLPPSILNAI